MSDSQHTANAVREYLDIVPLCVFQSVMVWPPQSLDHNIEAAWDQLDREWNKRQSACKEALLECPARSLENYS